MDTTKRTIKVAAYVTFDLDVSALEAEYGRTFTNAEARQDAKDSLVGVIAQTLYPESDGDDIVKNVRVVR